MAVPVALALFVGADASPSAEDREVLAQGGVRCVRVEDFGQAAAAARSAAFDALVVSARTVRAHGLPVLARLREYVRCPVVVLADADEEEFDEAVLLESGADICLRPPLASRRLCAQLLALVRGRRVYSPLLGARTQGAPAQAGGWQLDRVRNLLVHGNTRVHLAGTQAALLGALMDARGAALSRAQLHEALPKAALRNPRDIDVYVHRLRKRLARANAMSLVIDAVRGHGYALVVEAADTHP